MSKNLDSSRADFLGACRHLREFLQAVGAIDWEGTIQSIQEIDVSSVEAAMAALSYFGGMGSITDWMISERNGHSLDGKSSEYLNQQLKVRTTRLYNALTTILGEHHSDDSRQERVDRSGGHSDQIASSGTV